MMMQRAKMTDDERRERGNENRRRRRAEQTPAQRDRELAQRRERDRRRYADPEVAKRTLERTRVYEAKPDVRERRRAHYRSHRLKRKYGLTLEQYGAMAAAQGGRCALCGRRQELHVDHCHETGIVRGLLCKKCNTALGALGDTKVALQRVVRYLHEAQKRQQQQLPLGDTLA